MSDEVRRGSISRAAILITAVTAVSTLLGFVRDIVIAAVFGAGPDLDAYLVAQGLMNLVLGLIAGAMARSVVPVVARQAAGEGGRCTGHRSFDVAISMTMVVLGVGAVVMAVLAAPITTVLAPGFSPEEARLAETLTRVVLVATVLIAGTNLLASFSQAHERYFWAAAQGIPFNLVMIAGAAVFGPVYGVHALAVAFVGGSAARLVTQLPAVRALGSRIRPSFQLGDPGFREIRMLIPALLVGSAVGNVNTLVDRAVGSTVGDGAIVALSFGWRLVSLPETLLIASLLVPLYTALGAASKHPEELRRLVGRGLAATVMVLTPVCVVLAVAARPLVEAAFGHGAFDQDDIGATATAVVWYAPALLALGCREVMMRASLAVGDSKTPVAIAVAAMAINVIGDVTLGPVYGISGLAAATTLSLATAALLNAWALRRRHSAVRLRPFAAVLGRAALSAGFSVAAGIGVRELLEGTGAGALVIVAAVGVVVVAVHMLVLVALRAPERGVGAEVIALIRRRRR